VETVLSVVTSVTVVLVVVTSALHAELSTESTNVCSGAGVMIADGDELSELGVSDEEAEGSPATGVGSCLLRL